jgi:GxxExxY protein
MERELDLRKLSAIRQLEVDIEYKGLVFREPLKVDLLVENSLLIELKSVERILAVHKAQLLSYMKLLKMPVGLLINFHEPILKDGITRLILNTEETPRVSWLTRNQFKLAFFKRCGHLILCLNHVLPYLGSL